MLWNATSIQNKKQELQNFLTEHQVDIAIITETWLSPKNPFHLQNYSIHRKDRTVNPGEPTRGGVMIAASNKISFEDHTQSTSTRIENIAIKTRGHPYIIITAIYVPLKHKITPEELDQLTHKHCNHTYITGGDLEHQTWNNSNRNRNGVAIKKHAEQEQYQILHSLTYSYRQPRCNPSNLDIYLTNISYEHTIKTIDDLSSNNLLIMLTINTNRVTKRNCYTKHTDWKQYRKICNTYPITQNITTKEEIDAQILVLQKNIRHAYRKAITYKDSRNHSNSDPFLQQLIRDRHRRKYQKTGHLTHKLQRNLLTTLIRKKITETRNFNWQRKLQNINKMDHTLWQTYKITGRKNTCIPPLLEPETDTAHYSDQEKAEALAEHNNTYISHTSSNASNGPPTQATTYPIETTHPPLHLTQYNLTPRTIRSIISKLPNNKVPGPDKITTLEIKNLLQKSMVQVYYIFKACLLLSYFPETWKTAKIHPIPKPGKPPNKTSSYRAISLLNTLSKVLEKIIHHQLLTHLSRNQIIIPQQLDSVKNTRASISCRKSRNTQSWK